MTSDTFVGATACRCPRCRGTELTATEVTEAFMDFSISGGRITRITHSDEFGAIIRLTLKCNRCGHSWRPRRAQQITALVKAA